MPSTTTSTLAALAAAAVFAASGADAQTTAAAYPSRVPTSCNVSAPQLFGNGACENSPTLTLNTLLCGWDGGDCCTATCRPSNRSLAGNCSGINDRFTCKDPVVAPPVVVEAACNVSQVSKYAPSAWWVAWGQAEGRR